MDEVHRAEFATLLAAGRTQAQAALAEIESTMGELARDRADATADDEHDPEGVTLSAEWSRLEGLRTQQQLDLVALDAARARWDAGTYGHCVTCGRQIPVARLRVRPMAAQCVACAERDAR